MFITTADLSAHFGADNLANFTPEKAARAVAEANDLAASHLTGRYALPLYAVPDALRAACCDIATRRLYVFDCEESIQKAHDAALRWLRELADGRSVLVLTDDPATTTDEAKPALGVLFGGDARQYTATALRAGQRSYEWVA